MDFIFPDGWGVDGATLTSVFGEGWWPPAPPDPAAFKLVVNTQTGMLVWRPTNAALAGLTTLQTAVNPPPPPEVLTVDQPLNSVVGQQIQFSGTYANATPSSIDVSLDGGSTWTAVQSLIILGGGWTGVGPSPSATGGLTAIVRDHAQPSVTASTLPFSVAKAGDSGGGGTNPPPPVGETLSVTTPTSATISQPVLLSGTFSNVALTGIDYSVDGGSTWFPTTGFTTSGTETITVSTPVSAVAGSQLPLSGTFANGTPSAIDYSIDGGVTWLPITSLSETAGTWTGFGPTYTGNEAPVSPPTLPAPVTNVGSWSGAGPTPGRAERLVIFVRDTVNKTITASTGSLSVASAPRMGPLVVSAKNPRYLATPSGTPLYLCGSHTRNDLADIAKTATGTPAAFDFTAYLSVLQSYGMNCVRLWAAENPTQFAAAHETETPIYYLRTGPGTDFTGNPKFDLTKFNQAYFDRLRARCVQAGNLGMYVSIMLFDGWAQMAKNGAATDPYESHPYNPANNIAGTSAGTGYAIGTLTVSAITAFQEAYVRKVIDTVGDLDNVLYEVMNEPQNDASQRAFVWHWPAFIRSYEGTKGNTHPIVVSSPLPGEGDPAYALTTMAGSGAEVIAPGNTLGMTAATGSLVVLGDTAHSGPGLDANFVWQQFTLGYNVWYLDNFSSLTTEIAGALAGDTTQNAAAADSARVGMKGTRAAASLVDLSTAIPAPSAASSGYALKSSTSMVAYAPQGGTFTVDLSTGGSGPTPTLIAGIGTAYPTIAAAVAAAPNGIIGLTDGTYAPADIPAAAGNITLMAMNRRKVTIDGQGGHGAGHSLANDKGGIHVSPPASGRRSVTIRGICFINCGGADLTGDGEAGLYFETDTDGLVIDCQFDNNENGIFTRNPSTNVITAQNCEFGLMTSNGQSRDGFSHDVYMVCASYSEIDCYHYKNLWGHSLKSRSQAVSVTRGLYTYGGARAFDLSEGGAFTLDGSYISGVVGVGNCYGYADENTNAGVSNQSLSNATLVTIGPRLAFYMPNGGTAQFTNCTQIWVSDTSGQPSILLTGTGTITGLSLTPPGGATVLTTIPSFPTMPAPTGATSPGETFSLTWINVSTAATSPGGQVASGSATASLSSPFGAQPSAAVLTKVNAVPSMTVDTPTGVAAQQAVHLSGTYSFGSPTAVDYSIDGGGTWFPVASFVFSGSSWSGVGPTYQAAASGVSITVRDHNATTVKATSAAFSVSGPLAEAITVSTPTNALVNHPIVFTGTYANVDLKQLDYFFNGTWTTIPLVSTTIANGVWSINGPVFGSAKTAIQFSFRDHNNPTVTAATGSFNVTTAIVETITATAPSSVVINTPVPLTGTYSNGTPTALDYSVDGGTTWTAVSSITIGSGAWSGTGPTYAALASGNVVKVRDHTATTIVAYTGPISVVNSITESIGVNTPANVVTGVAVALSGTYANGAPTAFDYSTDGGVTWVAVGSPSISGGNWSGTGPTYSAPATGQAIVVRDHNATSITHATGTFDVTAPLQETITVNTPSSVFAGTPISLSGSYANGTPASFDYSTDGGVTWKPVTNLTEASGNWTGTGPTF